MIKIKNLCLLRGLNLAVLESLLAEEELESLVYEYAGKPRTERRIILPSRTCLRKCLVYYLTEKHDGDFSAVLDALRGEEGVLAWKRPAKAVPIVTNPEEATIVLKYELEQMRKTAFIQKYLPDKAEELSEVLGIENSISNHLPKLEKMLDDWLELYSKPNHKNYNNDRSVVKYWTELLLRCVNGIVLVWLNIISTLTEKLR